MSSTLEAPAAQANNSEQVPLDTIPISPAASNGVNGINGTNGNSDSDTKENANPNGTGNGAPSAEQDEQITIFHDKDNFNVKHPLINEWTLWFTKPPSGKVSTFPVHMRRASGGGHQHSPNEQNQAWRGAFTRKGDLAD